ncbi:MAG: M48 family metallopeptidase [Armatimonadetes bacterium]|nr:M48 family metallopeptidase [Armatimonadota bacterium]
MEIRIVRSKRRRKTVTASLMGGVLVVRLPEGMSAREEQQWVLKMRQRLERKSSRDRLNRSSELERRAQLLNERYFGGELSFSIRWVTNQGSRWGSCTPVDGSVRISHELERMPRFVLDYVIVHELAHLIFADHGPDFWELVHRYPQAEKAIGYLMGYAHARQGENPCGIPPRQPVPVPVSHPPFSP